MMEISVLGEMILEVFSNVKDSLSEFRSRRIMEFFFTIPILM